jgi:lon-related putative ATP-dependent protease
MNQELTPAELRRVCDPAILACETSRQAQPLDSIIGQDRAVKSLQFGLGIRDAGFNIFVSGMPGTGRTTTVRRYLEQVAREAPVPDGWCYVHRFADPSRPNALRFPPGCASTFQTDLAAFVSTALRAIRSAFESEQYAGHREALAQDFQRQRDMILFQVNEFAKQAGFSIQSTPVGLLTIPLRDGQPMPEEAFVALPAEDRETIVQARGKVQAEIEAGVRQVRRLEKESEAQQEKLDRDVASYALSGLIEELRTSYGDLPEISSHLDDLRDDMLANLAQIRANPKEEPEPPFGGLKAQEIRLRRYEANLLVDNGELTGAPVVIELNPTYLNLFGRIEQEAQFGTLVTDSTLIRGGALHKANGGYLVLPVEELLRNPYAWDSLKRALQNREITIEDAAAQTGLISTKSLRPEPISLQIKVILIGRPDLYYLLRAYDEDYAELFKVKADFDTRMDWTEANIRDYASFVSTVCENEKLRHLDDHALAKLVEHGARLVEDREKLSTNFGELADIVRESSYYAAQDGASLVTVAHIRRAIDERFFRSSLLKERMEELVQRGTIMIDVQGEQVGQVNGLSVLGLGDITFGHPNRITAAVAMGKDGLVDIEREAQLGGPIHTKGVLILSGYLAATYAADKPLSLSARLVFEQSYSGVEGDSASSTELYALLSSLAGLPVRQGIAVTGSVNQKGEVQAIGGVNAKIEGFFQVCQARGLTGDQGVMIPASNVPHLMLREEVVGAVESGQFHIWAVRTIDEGIEVLTGVPAGDRQAHGTFPEGTVNRRVDDRLRTWAEAMRLYGRGDRG